MFGWTLLKADILPERERFSARRWEIARQLLTIDVAI
jgi:hypothetical protein